MAYCKGRRSSRVAAFSLPSGFIVGVAALCSSGGVGGGACMAFKACSCICGFYGLVAEMVRHLTLMLA